MQTENFSERLGIDIATTYRQLVANVFDAFSACKADGMRDDTTRQTLYRNLIMLAAWLDSEDKAMRVAQAIEGRLVASLLSILHTSLALSAENVLMATLAAAIKVLQTTPGQSTPTLLELVIRTMQTFSGNPTVQSFAILVLYYSVKDGDLKRVALSMFALHRLRDVLLAHRENAKIVYDIFCCLSFFLVDDPTTTRWAMELNFELLVRAAQRSFADNVRIRDACRGLQNFFAHVHSLLPYKFD